MAQMRRLDELEAHYAVKKREVEALHKDVAERQAQLELHSARKKSTSSSAAETATGGAADATAGLGIPAVGRCAVVMSALNSRDFLETMPLYDAHNASSALRAAIECEAQLAAALKREVATLTTEYEMTTVRVQKVDKDFSNFQRETGYSTDTKAMAAINSNPRNLPRPATARTNGNGGAGAGAGGNFGVRAAASVSSGAPALSARSASARAVPETETEVFERQKKENADAFILQMKKVEEHLKASRLLQKKLEGSLRELDRAGHVQHETEMKVDQARNQALILDRDIAVKQAQLRDLRAVQAACDKEMGRIEQRKEAEQALLAQISGQFRKVKGEAADVGELRRQWEETVKAQDRRLAELRERDAMLEQAIEAHGMKPDVSRFVEAATAQRQQERLGPQPSDDLTDIISHYADVNMLAPPEETVPNGAIVLLTSLHDRLAHRVRCKEVLLDEKVSAADALKEHVAQLVSEHDSSEDRLYQARVGCEKEVTENVDSAKHALVDLREEYTALKNVSMTVQRKQRHESLNRKVAPLPDMQFKKK